MGNAKILVVDDDESVCGVLAELLSESGYRVEAVGDAPAALEAAGRERYDLYIIDLRLPGGDGVELLREVLGIDPGASCVVLTGYGTIEQSVKAIKAGAKDFITKPFDPASVRRLVGRMLHRRSPAGGGDRVVQGVVGESEAMKQVYELLDRVADSDSTILLQGESGTGKEVAAKYIHHNSARRGESFIPINCVAIPEALLESELFGHEKGAFTGATTARVGRFELAHRGTLFLDEVGEMPGHLQVKLLRVLQEKEIERVGGERPIRVDVRIIAATNQDLEEAIAARRFRRDLYYRLNIIPIVLPALRERKEDIGALAAYFVDRINERKRRNIQGITQEAIAALQTHDWPGNVRELENLIERMITIKQEGMLGLEDLPAEFGKRRGAGGIGSIEIPREGVNFSDMVLEFENQILEQAMQQANGVKSRAAELLRLNRTTLVEKLKRKGTGVGGGQQEES